MPGGSKFRDRINSRVDKFKKEWADSKKLDEQMQKDGTARSVPTWRKSREAGR